MFQRPHPSTSLAINIENIFNAPRSIDPVFLNTPTAVSAGLDAALGCRVLAKVETGNPVHSFKGRGTEWFVSTVPDPGEALVCASAGNFGQGLARAATLFDSNVICEYLDGLHQGWKWIPFEPDAHFAALRMQALAQGIADAGITARWETERRPQALRWPEMCDGQMAKIAAACNYLEREMDPDKLPDVGDVALATALSWIEFRSVYLFGTGRPRLSAWYHEFCARPSMLATALSGETHD